MAKPVKIFFIISIAIFSFGILSLYFLYNPLNSVFFPKCIFYQITNLHCPGCGTQRAVHNILQGNILGGLRHNLLIVLLLLVIIYKAILFVFNQFFVKEYKSLLQNSMVIKSILVVILLFWVLRNIDAFTFLAP